jgi:predicted GNAT family N-acyltransferase
MVILLATIFKGYTSRGGETMIQYHSCQKHTAVRKIGFSEKIWRCLSRSEQRAVTLRDGEQSEVSSILDEARSSMDLAPQEVIDSIARRLPALVKVADDLNRPNAPKGLTALLPLNSLGLRALQDGTFTGSHPDPRWLAALGEQPEAVYVWLIYMPGSFGRLLAAFASALEPYLETPVPVFSRATNPHSERLQRSSGFLPAKEFYPDCKEGLLVVFPEQSLPKPVPPKIEIKIARTIEEIFQVFSIRSATYIAEQFCLYSEEFDGNDFCATHFLGSIDGDVAGCIRLRFFNGFTKLERLAVRAEYRHSKLAYQLVRAALEHSKRKGYSKIIGHSRLDLVRFWKVFGFKPVANRPAFAFANVQYAELLLEQEPSLDRIDHDTDPMIVIRPEGAWEKPGPFDLSTSANDPRRKLLLAERTRTVGKQNIIA